MEQYYHKVAVSRQENIQLRFGMHFGMESKLKGLINMNKDFYEKLTEELPIGYAYHKILCDNNGNPIDYQFIEVNSAFERYTGLNRTDIIGKTICEVIPNIQKDDFDWITEYGKIALHGGRMEFEQYSAPLHKWYRVHVSSPGKDYFITFFIDITKEVEELNEHKALFTALNDAVFELNESYMFENLIAPDENVLFVPKHQILGKAVNELFPEEIANLIMKTLRIAKSSLKKETVDFPFVLENDSRWFRAYIKFIEIGGRKKYIMNILDISEQKHFEQELIDKTNELDRFFSVNLDLLCIADTDGNFIKLNKSWESTLGYSQQFLEGKRFLDFIHPDDLQPTLGAILKLEDHEEVIDFVNRYRCQDGAYKHLEWRSHPYGKLIYAAARDITQRKLMEDALYIEKEEFQTTLLSIGDGVIAVDKNQNVVLLNAIAEQLTGWSQIDATGKPFEKIFNIINERTREKVENPITKVLETENIVELANHTLLIRKDKSEIAIEDSAAPIRNKQGETQGVVLVFRDVTEKKKIRNEIEYLSFHDYLTGLYNRRFFEEELLRLDTERNLPLSVLMLDVNGLKLTNDAFGHEKGDTLLKKVSAILKNECRTDDIIARTGGDEFAVILPKTDNIQAYMIRKRIIDAAAKETLDSIIISVAVGNDTKNSSSQDINEILTGSENSMYKDKIKTSRAMRNQTLDLIISTLSNNYEKEQIHMERVGKICYHIGLALNMSQDELKSLEIAGFLHDIGKIMAPYEILNKPEKLTEEEYELIKRHTEAGYQILKSVEEYSPIAEYVLCHHERWDGNGYPRRLKEEEIPLVARIISVADAFEVMTAGRPYKKAMAEKNAIQELRKNSGTQFDPQIVDVFVEKVLNYQSVNCIMKLDT